MRRAVCAIAMLAAACGPPSPGPIVQRLVDEYAPGLPIGERLPDEARARHRLEYDAYIGYHDYEALDSSIVKTVIPQGMPQR